MSPNPNFVPNILKRGSSNGTSSSLTFSVYRSTNTVNIGDTRYYLAVPVAAATMDLTTNQVSSASLQNGVAVALAAPPAPVLTVTPPATVVKIEPETQPPAPTVTPPATVIKVEPETPPPSPPDVLATMKQEVEENENMPISQEETVETVAQVSSSPIHGGLGVAQLAVYESVQIRSPPKKDRKEELKEIIKARAKKDPTLIYRLLTPTKRRAAPTNRDRLIAIDLIKYGLARSDRGAADFAGVTTDALREWKKHEHLIRAAHPDSVQYHPAEPKSDEEMESN